MKAKIFAAGALLAALAGCKPAAEDIEFALIARGFSDAEATCVATGLEPLDDHDWQMLAELFGDTQRPAEDWQDVTVGELQGKLIRLKDTRVLGVLLRTGLGCALMHGGLDRMPA